MGVLNIFDQFSSISCNFFSGAEFSTVATKQKEILGEIFHCHDPKNKITCDMYKGFFWKNAQKFPYFVREKVRSHDI
jgi:hypothetical protein